MHPSWLRPRLAAAHGAAHRAAHRVDSLIEAAARAPPPAGAPPPEGAQVQPLQTPQTAADVARREHVPVMPLQPTQGRVAIDPACTTDRALGVSAALAKAATALAQCSSAWPSKEAGGAVPTVGSC